MINGDLPMHLDKRLTFEVALRMCAEIVFQKTSIKNEVTRLFTIVLIYITGFCAVNRKNIRYCRLLFIRMAEYRCR